MCGIHGIIQFNKSNKNDLLEKLGKIANITKHRGPDQNDLLVLGQVAVGMNRLSIVAPNEDSTIQTRGEDKRYALFNGEIVNHLSLRKLLKHPPKEKCDSAIILPLFEQFGPNFIQKLAGMFAIAIYDQKRNTLQLWRDPIGVKPLYYYFSKDMVIFSSEIKAIYAVMENAPDFDFAAIDHHLKYRFHPGVATVFPSIKRVLPGETIIFKDGKMISKKYWELTPNKKSLGKNITPQNFKELLLNVIKENIQADAKGGFFVSGGLDSSLITAMALKYDSSYKQPISIRFLPNQVEDEGYGKLLEKFFKKRFEWVDISDAEARKALEELVTFIDEPLENPIHIGTYLMAKRAHNLGIKSVLTGDGSDEFFLGYQRHSCWFEKNGEDPQKAYPKWLWTLKPDEASQLYTDEAKATIKPILDMLGHRIEPFRNVNQMLNFERGDRLSEYHNMRLDRMTMAHGVEAKVPFMDSRVADFALKIPLSNLVGSYAKVWLREVAKEFLPSQILDRKKIHFPSLPDQWVSGKGANWAAEILLDPRAVNKKWIKKKVLERYLNEHKNHISEHGRLIWALVVFELWSNNLANWRRN